MRRLLVSLVVAVGLLLPALSLAGSASAVNIFNDVCSGQGSGSSACQSVNAENAKNQGKNSDNPIIDVIRVAINVISYIIGIAAIVGLVVNSIRMIISGGGDAAASARSGIIACLVGLAVAVLALFIVNLVIGN